jgi:hypothetical protein
MTVCGEPSQSCVVPVGCVRIALKVSDATAQQHGVFTRYHRCFHGTTADTAKKIISTGLLLQCGQVVHSGERIGLPEGHYNDDDWMRVRSNVRNAFGAKHFLISKQTQDTDTDDASIVAHHPTKLFFTSPSLQYAMAYSPPCDLGGESLQVCFEMHQDPDSINVLHSTLHHSVADPLVPRDEMEWFTERNYPAIVPVALLIRVCRPHPQVFASSQSSLRLISACTSLHCEADVHDLHLRHVFYYLICGYM